MDDTSRSIIRNVKGPGMSRIDTHAGTMANAVVQSRSMIFYACSSPREKPEDCDKCMRDGCAGKRHVCDIETMRHSNGVTKVIAMILDR